METTVGVQSRYDDIKVGLTNTVQRQFLSNTRADLVKEGSLGIYGANQTAAGLQGATNSFSTLLNNPSFAYLFNRGGSGGGGFDNYGNPL